MTIRVLSSAFLAAGLLVAASAFAQTPAPGPATNSTVQRQPTDGASPTTVGPGSKAYKQPTEADTTTVGPGSKAFKTDGDSPTTVGPGSKAFKQ